MENWYTIQVWTGTEDGPNKARLDENIEYLGKNSNVNKGTSNLISDWGKRYTKNAFMDAQNAFLVTKNPVLGTKKCMFDTKNLFWEPRMHVCYQKCILGHKKTHL